MFCRIYVTGKHLEQNGLLVAICDLLNAELVQNMYVEKDGYSIEVRLNDEYDEKKETLYPDGFLYFHYNIEIDIRDDITDEFAAKEVSQILTYLWGSNYPAVASCDFENLLPKNGGYKSRDVPWLGSGSK